MGMLTLHSSPFDLFERLDQQIANAERVPNAEILDGESTYTVRLELPGVERDSIDIKATNRDLVICAQRPAAVSSDNQAPLLSEFRAGSWSRSFRFPHGLDREQLKASYRDGILEITEKETRKKTENRKKTQNQPKKQAKKITKKTKDKAIKQEKKKNN